MDSARQERARTGCAGSRRADVGCAKWLLAGAVTLASSVGALPANAADTSPAPNVAAPEAASVVSNAEEAPAPVTFGVAEAPLTIEAPKPVPSEPLASPPAAAPPEGAPPVAVPRPAPASFPAPVFAGVRLASAMPNADRGYDLAKAATPSPVHHTFGMSMDVGVPDGAALGIVVRPQFDWLRLSAAVTHNGIAPGVRGGITLDPIAFPIAPTLTIEAGHCWAGKIPTLQASPSIGYDYANFHLGLEFGNRSTFRFFLRGGASYIDMSAAQAQNTSGTSSIANPSYQGWLAPSAKLGFSLYF